MYVNHNNTTNSQLTLPRLLGTHRQQGNNHAQDRVCVAAAPQAVSHAPPQLGHALRVPAPSTWVEVREPCARRAQRAHDAEAERQTYWTKLESLAYPQEITSLLSQGALAPLLARVREVGELLSQHKAVLDAPFAGQGSDEAIATSRYRLCYESMRLRTLAAMVIRSPWPLDMVLDALREAQSWCQKIGSSLHYGNTFGDTFLHLACRSGTTDRDLARLLEFFLEMGADANQQDGAGSTPAHLLRHHVKPMPALIALIKGGANPNIVDGFGYTVMHQLAGHPSGSEALMLCSLARGDLSLRSPSGETLLHVLLSHQDDAVTTAFLLRNGVSPHARDHMGLNAFDYASVLGRNCARPFLGAPESSYDPRALVF